MEVKQNARLNAMLAIATVRPDVDDHPQGIVYGNVKGWRKESKTRASTKGDIQTALRMVVTQLTRTGRG
jgi:hypothetical protein